jgi:uncharacterized protein YgbK (DUF1537 family)
MNSIYLGCIADDFTGATDLANNLVRAGMRVVQAMGVPDGPLDAKCVDAVVVALKSRTVPGRRRRPVALAACAGCRPRARSRSTSSTAPPLTARPRATSARWPRR